MRLTQQQQKSNQKEISIHALQTECDLYLKHTAYLHWHFYPRTPNGVRPHFYFFDCLAIKNFYPRTPNGVRRGARTLHGSRFFYFYPRTPNGVRPWLWVSGDTKAVISIHALQTECDSNSPDVFTVKTEISIHALQTECDKNTTMLFSYQTYFYPRTPNGVRQQYRR